MPELAEVEYYRKQWNCGFGQPILAVELHPGKRVFRDADVRPLRKLLPDSVLVSSEARGKQMLFRFSNDLWLGLHLGMTGKLSVAQTDFTPGKHDHLVLRQKSRALIFTDMRQFGRVLFDRSPAEPEWWSKLPPGLDSLAFTVAAMAAFLQRHRRLPIKAALLLQDGFPGIGNWMADEILWRSRLNPSVPSGRIRGAQLKILWRKIRFVCQGAMKHVSHDFSDPPKGWIYHQRWNGGGRCPIDRTPLQRETIGGRTTAWCPRCQKLAFPP